MFAFDIRVCLETDGWKIQLLHNYIERCADFLKSAQNCSARFVVELVFSFRMLASDLAVSNAIAKIDDYTK